VGQGVGDTAARVDRRGAIDERHYRD
jgi:hypothetical protein